MNRRAVLSFIAFLVVAGRLGAETQSHPAPAPAADAAKDTSNPYAVIVDRNVFHLNPIPPEPAPEPPKVDLPVIKLSGFLQVGNQTRALFSSVPKDKKDAPTYYNLGEGEKDGILEVVKIHSDKGEVDVLNSGTSATLSLKDDTLSSKEVPALTQPEPHHGHRFSLAGGKPFPDRDPPGKDLPSRSQYQPPGGPRTPFAFPMRQPRLPVPQ